MLVITADRRDVIVVVFSTRGALSVRGALADERDRCIDPPVAARRGDVLVVVFSARGALADERDRRIELPIAATRSDVIVVVVFSARGALADERDRRIELPVADAWSDVIVVVFSAPNTLGSGIYL